MTDRVLRILLLADTHLGFDLPRRPRVRRRHRGPEFLLNFDKVLEPALEGKYDLVVHGGDLLHRRNAAIEVVYNALHRLSAVAEAGTPVVLVPGNHDGGHISLGVLWRDAGLHVLNEPETVALDLRGMRVTISGFPFQRDLRGGRFPALVEATGWREHDADIRLLAIHQAVEGAQVGVQDYTFRRGKDVVAGRDIPGGFAAVLAGHIHRSQILRQDLAGRELGAPVVYPGSIERTSYAERAEAKRCLALEVVPDRCGGRLVRHDQLLLPTRPMRVLRVPIAGRSLDELIDDVHEALFSLPTETVVRVEPVGQPVGDAEHVFTARHLRELGPSDMTIETSYRPSWQRQGRSRRA